MSDSYCARRDGSAMVAALALLVGIAALSAGIVLAQQKNLQQSLYFANRDRLRSFAENGLSLALHDIHNEVTGTGGMIGTANWHPVADDLGHDAVPASSDAGEGDGVPTPGEPNVFGAPVGPAAFGAELIVWVEDTFPGLKRIVSTCYRGDESVTVERHIEEDRAPIPRVGAIYLPPTADLTLRGQSFVIDGNDHNADGTLSGGDAEHGISTGASLLESDPDGLADDVPTDLQDQVLGKDGAPSFGYKEDVDVSALIDWYQGQATHTLEPGGYTNDTFGDYFNNDLHITVVNGDLQLSGQGEGAGVLLVNGDLELSGQFTFRGLVIVSGKAYLSGGGSGIQLYGGLVVTEALDVGGTSDFYYSSEVLDHLHGSFIAGYDPIYQKDY